MDDQTFEPHPVIEFLVSIGWHLADLEDDADFAAA